MSTRRIYTDGSCLNLRYGGWAFLDGKYKEHGGEDKTTNNRMELTAVIKVAEYLIKNKIKDDVTIVTDSKYVMMGIRGSSKKKGFNLTLKDIEEKKSKNPDLWKILINLVEKHKLKIDMEWVKAHDKDEKNIIVDELAREEANKIRSFYK
jgi:ribonuclease HI